MANFDTIAPAALARALRRIGGAIGLRSAFVGDPATIAERYEQASDERDAARHRRVQEAHWCLAAAVSPRTLRDALEGKRVVSAFTAEAIRMYAPPRADCQHVRVGKGQRRRKMGKATAIRLQTVLKFGGRFGWDSSEANQAVELRLGRRWPARLEPAAPAPARDWSCSPEDQARACCLGHRGGRLSNGRCVVCAREAQRAKQLAVSASEQQEPCGQGHRAGRDRQGRCVECHRDRERRRGQARRKARRN